MFFVLQTANVTADAKNCVYPNRKEITTGEALKDAVRFDHVCGEFRKDYRNISNFLKSNVIVMDCDNDHSDDPAEWITFEKLETLFEEVSYAAAPSRNHMKEKDGRAARPKFHVYFPIEETEDAEHYAAVKRAIQKAYPFFDDNALDAARFIFGSDPDEVVWHEGWVTIDEEVDPEPEDEEPETGSGYTGGAIMQGTRNKTLSHFAGRALKRFGETEKAKQVFLDEAAKCDPPLENEELKTIWYSALKFYRNKVKTQPGYVQPDEYNEDFKAGCLKPEDYSDIGQAKMLTKEYGEELRYSDATDYDRIESLELSLKKIKKKCSEARQGVSSIEGIKKILKNFGKFYEKLTSEEQRELYRQFIERIEVYPEEQEDGRVLKSIYFRFPVRYGETDTIETWIGAEDEPDDEIAFVLDCSEVQVTVAEAKATYAEIRAYVLEHTGMKVSSLYIAQIKRKYGIDVGIAYNKPEQNKNHVPVCPVEKELAIMDALKAFRMLTEDTEYMEAAV